MIYENCVVTLLSPNNVWRHYDVKIEERDGLYYAISPPICNRLIFNKEGDGINDRPDSDYARLLAIKDGKPYQAVIGYGEGI